MRQMCHCDAPPLARSHLLVLVLGEDDKIIGSLFLLGSDDTLFAIALGLGTVVIATLVFRSEGSIGILILSLTLMSGAAFRMIVIVLRAVCRSFVARLIADVVLAVFPVCSISPDR